jgi:hypothetical protein
MSLFCNVTSRATEARPMHLVNVEFLRLGYFISKISNSIFTTSFTFTVPPATVTGVIPKSLCFRVADPR